MVIKSKKNNFEIDEDIYWHANGYDKDHASKFMCQCMTGLCVIFSVGAVG